MSDSLVEMPILSKPAAVAQPLAAGVVVLKSGNEILAGPSGQLPTIAECQAAGVPLKDVLMAAEVGGLPCYGAAALPAETAVPHPFKIVNPRAFLDGCGTVWRQAAIRALELMTWRQEHLHCGCCGSSMRLNPEDGAMRCTKCGFEAFPVLAPAIIVRVTRGDHEILLGRNRHFNTPFFSNFAGFVESGETYEDAVHREVLEEVGVKVQNLRYFGSQNWPFPHTLLAAFTAEYACGEVRPDGEEIVEADWFDIRHPLPPVPQPGSISRAMIDDFLASQRRF
ncbi:MAG: NAD(+) diphosphatase [Victivallales bacterium]|nr:NAD(+) diphosphatase [Victivallales bacterium]